MSDLTIRQIFEEKIPALIAEKSGSASGRYKFVLTGPQASTWVLDLDDEENPVAEGDDEADCTVKCSDTDFIDMYTGKVPGPQLFMMGKLKIEGDMGMAMKLGSVLGG